MKRHLSEYIKEDPPQEERNFFAQQLWNFYTYQVHALKKVHADPHPGNILITDEGKLAVIDFGCVKSLPMDFYTPYAELIEPGVLRRTEEFMDILTRLEIFFADDTDAERRYFHDMFHEMLSMALMPYQEGVFDFGDKTFFKNMSAMGERMSRESPTSEYKPNRGSKHFIYVNRTFFGLYNLLHLLKGVVDTRQIEFA